MRALILATTLILGVAGTAVAQDKAHVTTPDLIQWGPAPPALPKGAQMAVLAGDPGKAGPFTVRLKTPAGYKIPAHQHPTAEAVTVISGEFNFGMGDKLDEAKAQKLGPGGFVDLPANMNHFAFATSESVVQLSSEGPFSSMSPQQTTRVKVSDLGLAVRSPLKKILRARIMARRGFVARTEEI